MSSNDDQMIPPPSLEPVVPVWQLDDLNLDAMATAVIGAARREVNLAPRASRPLNTRRVLAVIAVAAAVVGALAVIPTRFDHGATSHVAPETVAAKTLHQAADAAASEDWSPLAPGEFAHVKQIYFFPKPPKGAQVPPRRFGIVPGSREVWITSDGSGQSLDATGMSICGMKMHHVSIEKITVLVHDLCSTQIVTTTNWRAGAQVTHSASSFVFDGKARLASGPTVYRNANTGGRYNPVIQSFGATMDELAAIPASGPQVVPSVRALVDRIVKRSWWLAAEPSLSRQFTPAYREGHARIETYMQLLGSAPLPPAARGAIFDLLAHEPQARLGRHVRDRLGRSGTRVWFGRTSMVIDPTTGVLLQMDEAGGVAMVFVQRNRTSDTTSRQKVCQKFPRICGLPLDVIAAGT